ncbi:hypothetical protein BJ508DRAFT_314257 [Ascobolus immersus RN42]|uniref:F-box domain-containing protein n=1 Tax=Ascobolus immersus RN42 TaxID=1160509 RepID=A0A3N4HFS6_ASCIM|nr:hypothetical protein BJ508DRAFT_314257 [Ascobolus immersus RN42]
MLDYESNPIRGFKGFLTMPNELVIAIGNKLDDWRDLQCLAQVNKRVRQVLYYKATKFKTMWFALPASEIVWFGQELLWRSNLDIILDLKNICGLDPNNHTGISGYGYETFNKFEVTWDENINWFRNIACMCNTLQYIPIPRLQMLFQVRNACPSTRQHSLFLQSLDTMTPIGLITYLRELLLSDEGIKGLCNVHSSLRDLMSSMAIVFGNARRAGMDLVLIPCDSTTDLLGRHYKPVFESDLYIIDGFVPRTTKALDLLLLVQYYRLVSEMLNAKNSQHESTIKCLFYEKTIQVVSDVEDFWPILQRMYANWDRIEGYIERGEDIPRYISQIEECSL